MLREVQSETCGVGVRWLTLRFACVHRTAAAAVHHTAAAVALTVVAAAAAVAWPVTGVIILELPSDSL